MELERLAHRSVRAIRRLLRSAPDAPSLNPIETSGDLNTEQQCSPENNQCTESPTRPTEPLSELVNAFASGTAILGQTTEAHENTLPNPIVVTDATNCQDPTSVASGTLAQSSSTAPSQEIEASSSVTSRITNVDSLGFETILTSSISSPPSEIAAPSTDFVGAVVFAQKVIVAPNMRHKIDPELQSDWEKRISRRLWNDLDELGTGAVVALEFHMAGENKKSLKPTIIITCDGAKSQKHNKKKVRGLKWLESYHLQCCVVKNSDKRRLQAFTKAKENCTMLPYEVIANLGHEPTTLCGIPAALKDSALETTTPFRLGGLIMVDAQMFCLTAGHVAVPSHSQSFSTDIKQSQSYDSDSSTDMDDSSLIFTIGECVSDDDTEVANDDLEEWKEVLDPVVDDDSPKGASVINLSDTNDWTLLGDLNSHFSVEEAVESRNIYSSSDWGLIRLKDRRHWLPNSMQMPGKWSRTFIEDVVAEDQLSPGQVWAITEPGRPKRGLLSSGSSFIYLYGARLRVRQIAFDEALGMCFIIQGCDHQI